MEPLPFPFGRPYGEDIMGLDQILRPDKAEWIKYQGHHPETSSGIGWDLTKRIRRLC
jgi:hypothetical protein